MSMELCSDCPPVGYSSDKTRCEPCPRHSSAGVVESAPTPTVSTHRELIERADELIGPRPWHNPIRDIIKDLRDALEEADADATAAVNHVIRERDRFYEDRQRLIEALEKLYDFSEHRPDCQPQRVAGCICGCTEIRAHAAALIEEMRAKDKEAACQTATS